MKKIFAIVVTAYLSVGLTSKTFAQYYFYDGGSYNNPLMFEIGVGGGIMNCLTDLGGKDGLGKKFVGDLNLGNTKLNGNVYLTATYKEAVALRLEGTFGNISAHDSVLTKTDATTGASKSGGRYERNLHFKSKITEFAAILEFHPLFMFVDWSLRDDQDPPRFSPYLAAGIGYFSFNPQAKTLRGEYVDLQPLSTEGQGFSQYPDRKIYKLNQISLPIGIGVRYELSSSFYLRAEILHRTLFTDYLDDVSTKYVDPTYFANYLSGTQLTDALELHMNQIHNTGPKSDVYRKTEGGIRGKQKNNDSYFTMNLKIGFLLGRENIR